LTPAARDRLQAALVKITGKQVLMTATVDESLIGGVVARVAGMLLDGSLRTQLKAVQQQLTLGGER
jgi:F-type H+-transporting ATPase subunit delta